MNNKTSIIEPNNNVVINKMIASVLSPNKATEKYVGSVSASVDALPIVVFVCVLTLKPSLTDLQCIPDNY